MTKSILFLFASTLATTVAFAEKLEIDETNAAGEYRPDWQALCATGKEIEMPANAKWVAYEEDMTYLHELKGSKLSLRQTSTLILDDTTTWFGADRSLSVSSGTLVKRGTSRLIQTGYNYNFRGKFIIEEGILEVANYYPMSGEHGSEIIVKDGATLDINFKSVLGTCKITAEGTGYNGMGAIVYSKAGTIQYLVLSNDATIAVNTACSPIESYVRPLSATGGANHTRNPAPIELNGYKLTIAGTATTTGLRGVSFPQEGGEIEVLGDNRVFCLFSATDVDADPRWQLDMTGLGKLTLPAGANLQFFDTPIGTNNVPLEAKGNLTISANYTDRGYFRTNEGNVWAGPIAMADGATLTVTPSTTDAKAQINLLGPISGNANLVVGSASAVSKGVVVFGGQNTYTGTTDIYGHATPATFSAYFDYPIPNAATKLTISSGTVNPRVGYTAEGATTWSEADILTFGKGIGSTLIAPDCSALTNKDDLVFTAEKIAASYPGYTGNFGCAGTGAYTIEGPFATENKLNIRTEGGEIVLSGEGTINLGSAIATGVSTTDYGTLRIENAEDVVFGDDPFIVGYPVKRYGETPNAIFGRLIVSNASLRSSHVHAKNTGAAPGALFVGYGGYGQVDVEAGAVISNRLALGSGYSYYQGAGFGVVRQRGGEVYIPADGEPDHYASNVGNAGTGYYELTGGLLWANKFVLGGYHSGHFLQNGGHFKLKSLNISTCNGGQSVFTILKGTTEMTGGGYFQATMGNSGHMYFTVDGPEAEFIHTNNCINSASIYCNNNSNNWVVFNINHGGKFWARTFVQYALPLGEKVDYPFVLNFNGGRFMNGNEDWSASSDTFTNDSNARRHRLIVYEDGMEVSSELKTLANKYTPIEGAFGGGIASIEVPNPATGYYVPPRVEITGEGFGATAVALLDVDTHTVTNILITSHGCGYKQDTTVIKLYHSVSSVFYTYPNDKFVVSANEPGGFSKYGAGLFNLYQTNTWAKWTKVLGGTLRTIVSYAIPSNTVLTLSNGAKLDFLNKDAAPFIGLAGTGGTVENGAIKLADGATISAEQFVNGETCAISGTLDLTGVKSLALTDAALLDDAQAAKRGAFLFTATTIRPADPTAITMTGLPEGWDAKMKPTGLRLAPKKGLVLLLK